MRTNNELPENERPRIEQPEARIDVLLRRAGYIAVIGAAVFGICIFGFIGIRLLASLPAQSMPGETEIAGEAGSVDGSVTGSPAQMIDTSATSQTDLPTSPVLPTDTPKPPPTVTLTPTRMPTATDTPVPPPEFFDDFSSWPGQWEQVDGEWTIVNQKLTRISDCNGTLMMGNSNWQNYSVEVEILIEETGSLRQETIGIIVAAPSDSEYLAFAFSHEYDNRGTAHTYWAYDLILEDWAVAGTILDVQWNASVSNRVRVEFKGNLVSAFINDEFVSSTALVTGRAARGRVGLGVSNCYFDHPLSYVRFDNFRVSPLP